jgi:hypothetical protein
VADAAAPGATRSFGPSWSEYKRNFLAPLLTGGIAGLVVAALSGFTRIGLWALLVVLVLVALAMIYLAMYFHLLRVTVDASELRYRSSFGITRRWPIGAARTAVLTERLLTAEEGRGAANSGRNLFVFDQHGRRLFRLSSGAWSLDDLHAIAAALPRAHVEELDRLLDETELNRLHPHATPWAEQHPMVFGLIAGVGGAVVFFGVVALIALAMGTF